MALLMLAMLLDHFVLWPSMLRRALVQPVQTWWQFWSILIVISWISAVGAAVLWVANDRAWNALGFTVPQGWRLWVAAGLVLVPMIIQVRGAVHVAHASPAKKEKLRNGLGNFVVVLPRTRAQLTGFFAVSLTAGFVRS